MKREVFRARVPQGSTHDRSATVTGPVGAVPNARATEGAVEGRRLRSALLRAMLLSRAEQSEIGTGTGPKKSEDDSKIVSSGKSCSQGSRVASSRKKTIRLTRVRLSPSEQR